MIGERLDVLPDCIATRPAVNNLSITDCEPLVRRLVLAPLQCNSARYTSALKYQGESHHSLRSIDLEVCIGLKTEARTRPVPEIV